MRRAAAMNGEKILHKIRKNRTLLDDDCVVLTATNHHLRLSVALDPKEVYVL